MKGVVGSPPEESDMMRELQFVNKDSPGDEGDFSLCTAFNFEAVGGVFAPVDLKLWLD